MRALATAALRLTALLLSVGPALADPRCGRFGQPAYSATRVTAMADSAASSQAFIAGAQIRLEAAGPDRGRMVTLLTPQLSALFLTTADPPVAMRIPAARPPEIPPEAWRQREEPGSGRITLITEIRGEAGQWHEVERVLCRRDGVLLEARQMVLREGRAVISQTRQSDIRLGAQDAALFRLPEGFRLVEPPRPPGG